MSKRKITRTDLFDKMIDHQVLWYVRNADDPRVPERFLDAIESAIQDISLSPQAQSKFFASRKEFSHLDKLNFWRKQIDPKFQFFIYFQFDDKTITLRFIYRSSRNVEARIVDDHQQD